jgi:hypothetical protein
LSIGGSNFVFLVLFLLCAGWWGCACMHAWWMNSFVLRWTLSRFY